MELLTNILQTNSNLIISSIASIIIGLGIGWITTINNSSSKSFIITLATMPIMVQVVIMMVNGNVGTGVAVLGAFSLIRFRSIAGSAREIGAIFLSMAIGLANGMGEYYLSIFIFLIVGLFTIVLHKSNFGNQPATVKELRLTIPENLDYEVDITPIINTYSKTTQLIRVRTINMGSLFELTYSLELSDISHTQKLLNDLRLRNSNLPITLSSFKSNKEEL